MLGEYELLDDVRHGPPYEGERHALGPLETYGLDRARREAVRRAPLVLAPPSDYHFLLVRCEKRFT